MTGISILLIVGILVWLGLAKRALERLYLNEWSSLAVVVLLIVGNFISFHIWRNPEITVNIGGALVPLGLSIYVLCRAGSSKEWLHSLFGVIITTLILYGVNKLYAFDVGSGFIDPQYLWAIIAAIVGYLIGRSRRLAFVVSTLSLLFMDIVHIVETQVAGSTAATHIGGAGAFDSIVIAGVGAVILAEFFGEGREIFQGGSKTAKAGGKLSEVLSGNKEDDKEEGE